MLLALQQHLLAHRAALGQGDLVWLGVLVAKDVLVIYSVLSVAVMIERVLSLRQVGQAEAGAYGALREALRGGQVEAARTLAGAGRAPSAAALQAGLEHGSSDVAIMREAIAQEVVVQASGLQRNLPLLATVASTAPYVGLFGTVLGILQAFHTIAATGRTGAGVVAGGISEALITTALGLGVAIPAVVAYNSLSGVVNRLSLVVETHALDLASRLPPSNAAAPGEEGNTRADATEGATRAAR